jgi:hypothetical protein
MEPVPSKRHSGRALALTGRSSIPTGRPARPRLNVSHPAVAGSRPRGTMHYGRHCHTGWCLPWRLTPACVTPWLPPPGGVAPLTEHTTMAGIGPRAVALSMHGAGLRDLVFNASRKSFAGGVALSLPPPHPHHIQAAAIARNSPLTLALLSWAAVVNAATACMVAGATSPPRSSRRPFAGRHAFCCVVVRVCCIPDPS